MRCDIRCLESGSWFQQVPCNTIHNRLLERPAGVLFITNSTACSAHETLGSRRYSVLTMSGSTRMTYDIVAFRACRLHSSPSFIEAEPQHGSPPRQTTRLFGPFQPKRYVSLTSLCMAVMMSDGLHVVMFHSVELEWKRICLARPPRPQQTKRLIILPHIQIIVVSKLFLFC